MSIAALRNANNRYVANMQEIVAPRRILKSFCKITNSPTHLSSLQDGGQNDIDETSKN